MLVKIILIIVAIWILLKLLKFIGKKIILIILLLGIAYFAMSQTPDTSKSLSKQFTETSKQVKETTNAIVKSDEFKEAKKSSVKALETTVKAVGSTSATIYYVGSEWFKEGWEEKKKELKK